MEKKQGEFLDLVNNDKLEHVILIRFGLLIFFVL